MALTVTTQPAEEPVSIAELKGQSSLTDDVDNPLLLRIGTAARLFIEKIWNVALVTQTLQHSLDAAPRAGAILILPRPPAASIVSIVYRDSDGASQTWAAANYQADFLSLPGRIAPAYGIAWPSTRIGYLNAFQVNYTAGYGAASAVPAPAKQAILLLAAHWFVNRESVLTGTISKEIEFSLTSLRAAFGSHWMGG